MAREAPYSGQEFKKIYTLLKALDKLPLGRAQIVYMSRRSMSNIYRFSQLIITKVVTPNKFGQSLHKVINPAL
ncbi:hypothetical protein [Sodalis sp. (in: enterobacteria)]|uniref:hypothetical protein n=1 Tax=Sodalis sp. (in: enterobacteria) TaxID=1898979 RepID=UPI003F6864ED